MLSTSSRATANGNGLSSAASPAAQALRPHGEYAAGLDGSKGKVLGKAAVPSIQQMPLAAAMCAVCGAGASLCMPVLPEAHHHAQRTCCNCSAALSTVLLVISTRCSAEQRSTTLQLRWLSQPV